MKVQNPIIGRSRGSAGGMTFCKVYDKNVARAKAFEVANPKTAAQTTQRNYFKELTALVATFTEEQLRFLFPNKPKAMSRRNALAKQLADYYTVNAGVKTVDYATIDTIGNASTMDMGTTTATIDNNHINVDLEGTFVTDDQYKNNFFAAVVINTTKRQLILPAVFDSVEGAGIVVPMPSDWESTDVIKAFPLITNMTTQPTSFGTMYVVKRPAKANA